MWNIFIEDEDWLLLKYLKLLSLEYNFKGHKKIVLKMVYNELPYATRNFFPRINRKNLE